MDKSLELTTRPAANQRPWDARAARWLVTPLKDTWVAPNHLTTLRLAVGISAAAAFIPGRYLWSNVGALLLVLSNFLDHADGELARISGKGSRIGHLYDLASDAFTTVLLFVAIGVGSTRAGAWAMVMDIPAQWLGFAAGVAVAAIFLMRMRIEEMAGKAGTRQASLAGFETEDILYLLPVVTLCNGLTSFLKVAAVGAPLFALWVAIDFARVLARRHPGEVSAVPPPPTAMSTFMDPRLLQSDIGTLHRQFLEQGAFVSVVDFAGAELTAQLTTAAGAARSLINRNYVPAHKQGGSVSRYSLDRCAPIIGELYRSPAFIDWLSQLCGERLQPAPAQDPHAYAFYFYTEAGDHIGWHYDNSYYAGRRYTVLIGVIENSSCRLEYELHTREPGAPVTRDWLHMAPGDLVFFDGDRLRHRITPLHRGELRVSLTLEYVTDPTMHPWWRFVSNMKDAIAYFGFRQVFGRALTRTGR